MKIELIDLRVDQKWQSYYDKTVNAYLKSLPGNIKSLFGTITVRLFEPDAEIERQFGQHVFYSGGLKPVPFIHLYPKRFQEYSKTDDQQFDLLTTMLDKCVADLTKQLRTIKQTNQLKERKI